MKKRMGVGSVILICLFIAIVAIVFIAIFANDEPEEKKATVKFQTFTDVKIDPVTVNVGDRVSEPTVELERPGYTLYGWYKEDKAKVWYFKTYAVNEDITLSALWVRYLSYKNADDGSDSLWIGGCNPDVDKAVIPEKHDTKDITGIAPQGFADKKLLKTVILTDNITYIGANAFDGCDSLETIIIPASVEKIDSNAFINCKNLKTIYCEADSLPSTWSPRFNSTDAEVIYGYNADENK